MEPSSPYEVFSDASNFISLSPGSICQEAAKELLKPKPWSGMERNRTCNSNRTLHNGRDCSFNFFESPMTSKRKRYDGYVPSEDDVGLVLELGRAHSSLKDEGSSGKHTSLGTLTSEVGEQDCLPINLGLGLTQSSGCELSNDGLTSSREINSSISSYVRACRDSEIEGYQNDSLRTSWLEHNSLSLEPQHGGDTIKGFGALISNDTCGVDLQLGLSGSTFSAESDCLSVIPFMVNDTLERRLDVMVQQFPWPDEGSTSKRKPKPIASLLFADHARASVDTTNVDPNLSISRKTPAVSASSTGTLAGASERASKRCNFNGCAKGARGASGLCIAHGGGRRCKRPTCNKGAEGRTMYCKAHGGGRRCESLGCIKSAEGKTDFCIAHGGGRRCSFEGCNKAARGKSGLCIRHGGGKRCQKEGCTKSAEGFSGLCISHGGGRRCQSPGCGKGAQGSTMFCKAHGGGRRCVFEGCTKGAEGSTSFCKAHGGGKRCMFGGGTCSKSVHGGTSFCVAHGGGKRCAVPGCSKSARGRTDFCVRHGGGKRCQSENCDKSAQGSTDFCKAHGGGKRCSWFQEGSLSSGNLAINALNHLKEPCDRFARGKTGLCAKHSVLMEQLTASWDGTTLSSYSKVTTLDSFQAPVVTSIHNGQVLQSLSHASEKTSQFVESESLNWMRCKARVISREDLTTDVASEEISFGVTGRDTSSSHFRYSFPEPASHNKIGSAVNIATKRSFVDVQHPYKASGNFVPLPEKSSVIFSTQCVISSGMQKDVLVLDQGQHLQNASPSYASDDIGTMSGPEERVHGGGLIALLAREAASHDLE